VEQSVYDYEEGVLVKVWMQQVVYCFVNWTLQFRSYCFDDLVDVVFLFST